MRAGRLNQRITITAPGALDPYGQRTTGASVEVWADMQSPRRADKGGGRGGIAEATCQATIRFRTVDIAALVAWNGRSYAVVAKEWDPRRTSLTLFLMQR